MKDKDEKKPAQAPPETEETAPLEDELLKLRQELDEHKQQYLRVLAEYDNFRKRTANEKSAIYNNAVSDTVQAILPIADNIGLALDQENGSAEDMHKGVEMIQTQINAAFEKLGITSVGKIGEIRICATLSPILKTRALGKMLFPWCIKRAICWATGSFATLWYR